MAASRRTATILAGTKLVIFVIVSLIVTGTLTAIMGSFSFEGQTDYRAVFSSASMIKKGDDVRIAGVAVGQVSGVEIKDRNDAEIALKIKSDVPMTRSTKASIRFLNLVGKRYLALSSGTPDAPKLPSGATIPKSQTEPALNLTELFNGFQPLFQALQPEEVNDLSMNLIRVLQGEGGTIAGIMRNTASLTNTLADRDQLIGEVITNLSSLLKTVDDRHDQLNSLIIELRQYLGKVSRDRKAIGASVANLDQLTGEVASLLTQARPFLKADVARLREVMATLNKPTNQKVLDELLERLPLLLIRQTRTGTYGSWYNYYLCDVGGGIILPKLGPVLDELVEPIQEKLKNLSFYSTAKRCVD